MDHWEENSEKVLKASGCDLLGQSFEIWAPMLTKTKNILKKSKNKFSKIVRAYGSGEATKSIERNRVLGPEIIATLTD